MTTPDDGWIAVKGDVVQIRETGELGRIRDVRFEGDETILMVRVNGPGHRPRDGVYLKRELSPPDPAAVGEQGRLF